MVHAIPLDLSAVRNAARQDDVSSWDGPVVGELDNLPDGEQTYWGIPFELGTSDATKSWIRLSEDGDAVPVGRSGITHFVIAHFCDAEPGVSDNPGMSGMVMQPGEQLAAYTLAYADGDEQSQPVRRPVRDQLDGSLGTNGLCRPAAERHGAGGHQRAVSSRFMGGTGRRALQCRGQEHRHTIGSTPCRIRTLKRLWNL